MNQNVVVNKPAGFWIRLITRAIDFIWPFAIGVAVAFSFLKTTNGQKDFAHPYMFYIWCVLTMFLFFTSFVLVPTLTKGQTVGMFITRTKVVFEQKNIFLSMCRREIIMGFSWIFIVLLLMSVVNHTLIGRFAQNKQHGAITYTNLEKLRIGVVSSVSTIMIIIQFLSAIGIIVKADKRGFHDHMSQTRTVWVKRKLEVQVKTEVQGIKPRPTNNVLVEWTE